MTPAAARSAKRAASTEEGLASSVISIPSAKPQWRSAASRIEATVAGGISEGVPPPKKIEVSRRSGSASASCARSASSAFCHAAWSTDSRTWLLKSQ
ncbi:hypothetical protein QE385_002955 [Sphingomonas sp. SORGH_AS 950]|nr:hypothetical protein [Sphingomonas sp. SORGH_AS_0950]